jgi:hypothetical protein
MYDAFIVPLQKQAKDVEAVQSWNHHLAQRIM